MPLKTLHMSEKNKAEYVTRYGSQREEMASVDLLDRQRDTHTCIQTHTRPVRRTKSLSVSQELTARPSALNFLTYPQLIASALGAQLDFELRPDAIVEWCKIYNECDGLMFFPTAITWYLAVTAGMQDASRASCE